MRITKTINLVANKRRAIAFIILVLLMSTFNIIIMRNSARQQLDEQLSNKLNNTMDQMVNEINLEYERDMINMMYASIDNSIRYSLYLNLNHQLESTCNTIILKRNISNLVVVNHSGTIVYSSFSGLEKNDRCPIDIQKMEQFGQYYCGRIYEYYYYPIIVDEQMAGGIFTFSSLDNYHKIINHYLQDKKRKLSYRLWEFRGEEFWLYDNRGMLLASENPGFKHKRLTATAYFSDDNADYLNRSDRDIQKRNKSGIILQITEQDYKRLYNLAMNKGMRYAAYISIFFVIFVIALDKVLRVSMYRNVKMKVTMDNLRMQKHEFLRHINIVNGLLQYNETEKLKKYVESITSNMSYLYDVGKIKNPAIEILIKEKEEECLRQDVYLNFMTNTKLNDIRFEDFDLCTILGNLIDNSIEAVLKRNTQRKIDVEVDNQLGFYIFKVTNNGPMITHKEMRKIFRRGYTTKEIQKGHGIGLTIVKKVVQKYKGNLEVDSSDTHTSFTVCLPE